MAAEGRGRRGLGARGEKVALSFLEAQGFRILERNYRCQAGEVDLVAQDGECLVFVEVRSRTSTHAFGSPEESITQEKKERLAQVAESYLAERGSELPAWRIDVVAVDFAGDGGVRRVELFRNAILI